MSYHEKRRNPSILRAPFAIALAAGLVLYFTQLPLPALCWTVVDDLRALNTPLAMFVIGVYLAQTDLRKMLHRRQLYTVSLVRLVAIPLLSMLLLSLLPAQLASLKLAVLIAAACPVGSNVAVYAQLNGKDVAYAAETVVISTLLSAVTLPLMIALLQTLW